MMHHLNRRKFSFFIAALPFGVTGLSYAQEKALAANHAKLDEPTKKAITKALAFIATKQNPDGSWSDGGYQHSTAITSFALLAYMSQGHLPGQGMYGPEVNKGAQFLIASAREPDGLLIGARGGGQSMYSHGIATLTLSQLWGMTADDAIRPVLKRAVDLIIRSQNPQGGWRYNPTPADADISVTVMQVMALRAAKNAGLHVPDQTLKKAIEYIESCRDAKTGGYCYQPRAGGPEFARTAAGLCVLQLAGKYDSKDIPQAVEYLEKHSKSKSHFWYGHYYASHAMHQVGGAFWDSWYAKLKEIVLPEQGQDGSWSGNNLDSHRVGPIYQTSIAVIALSVPAQYIPIFQR